MTDGGHLPGNSSSGQLRARNYLPMRTGTQARSAKEIRDPTFRIIHPYSILYVPVIPILIHIYSCAQMHEYKFLRTYTYISICTYLYTYI